MLLYRKDQNKYQVNFKKKDFFFETKSTPKVSRFFWHPNFLQKFEKSQKPQKCSRILSQVNFSAFHSMYDVETPLCSARSLSTFVKIVLNIIVVVTTIVIIIIIIIMMIIIISIFSNIVLVIIFILIIILAGSLTGSSRRKRKEKEATW